MKIAVSSQGQTLDAATSPVFGRCPAYILVDTETMDFEALANPALASGGGAGIQAAQFVVSQGAEAVLSGNLGPNAFDVLEAAGVAGYLVPQGTVRQAVEAFRAGDLDPMPAASVRSHAGLGNTAPAPPAGTAPPPDEVEALRQKLKNLRQQLAETMDEIERVTSRHLKDD
jgi:predicted Fe-Mo cluster-binding NifX family protein